MNVKRQSARQAFEAIERKTGQLIKPILNNNSSQFYIPEMWNKNKKIWFSSLHLIYSSSQFYIPGMWNWPKNMIYQYTSYIFKKQNLYNRNVKYDPKIWFSSILLIYSSSQFYIPRTVRWICVRSKSKPSNLIQFFSRFDLDFSIIKIKWFDFCFEDIFN